MCTRSTEKRSRSGTMRRRKGDLSYRYWRQRRERRCANDLYSCLYLVSIQVRGAFCNGEKGLLLQQKKKGFSQFRGGRTSRNPRFSVPVPVAVTTRHWSHRSEDSVRFLCKSLRKPTNTQLAQILWSLLWHVADRKPCPTDKRTYFCRLLRA